MLRNIGERTLLRVTSLRPLRLKNTGLQPARVFIIETGTRPTFFIPTSLHRRQEHSYCSQTVSTTVGEKALLELHFCRSWRCSTNLFERQLWTLKLSKVTSLWNMFPCCQKKPSEQMAWRQHLVFGTWQIPNCLHWSSLKQEPQKSSRFESLASVYWICIYHCKTFPTCTRVSDRQDLLDTLQGQTRIQNCLKYSIEQLDFDDSLVLFRNYRQHTVSVQCTLGFLYICIE